MGVRSGRYVAIDIGTVTCRLLVADVADDASISEVHRDYAICNLGVGVDKTGVLADDAIERVVVAIGRFCSSLNELRQGDAPIPVRAVATSASRDAANATVFLARLAQFGVVPEVISGEEEAALSFLGATSAFPGETVVVADIGGGSTEVVAGQSGAAPVRAHSFNVGCRRVTERFLAGDPPTPEALADAAGWVKGKFASYLGELRAEGLLEGRLVAVAGTATSIISMRDQMAVYDSSRVHGSVATRAEVEALLDRLARMTLEERRHVVGLDPERAPVIVAGLLIMRQLLAAAGLPAFTASESDILHGIVLRSAGCGA